MTTLTENPHLDDRSRKSIAEIEASAQEVIDDGDTDAQATQLTEVIAWRDALVWAIADHKTIIKSYEDADQPDAMFIEALHALMLTYKATLVAADVIAARLGTSLDTVRVT